MDTFVLCLISLSIGILGLVLSIFANIKYLRLYRSYDLFMRGKNAETLEDFFRGLNEKIENLEKEDGINKDRLREMTRTIRTSYQKTGVVRYNAFSGMGGNMSFALALLDYTNTGFIINSVHSREGCFLYVKEVEAGTTETELGAEEKYALEIALGYKEKVK